MCAASAAVCGGNGTRSTNAAASSAVSAVTSNNGTAANERYPTLSRIRISSADFVEHNLRNHQVECRPPRLPPPVRQLLAASHDQVATGSTCQVADDARFDETRRFT